jgi:hypothetical protein
MQKSPLSIVKEKHGDKAKLVAALESFAKDGGLWLDRLNDEKGLSSVSNAKLVRLHRVFSEVKDRFGTRAKLIDAVLEAQKRSKDTGLRARLEAYPVPRLYDLYRTLHKNDQAVKASAKGVSGEAAAPARAKPKAAPEAKEKKAAAAAGKKPAASAKPKAAPAKSASKAKPAAKSGAKK